MGYDSMQVLFCFNDREETKPRIDALVVLGSGWQNAKGKMYNANAKA